MLHHWLTWIRTALAGEEGQDLSEFAFLTALIAVALIAAVAGIGGELEAFYTAIKNGLVIP